MVGGPAKVEAAAPPGTSFQGMLYGPATGRINIRLTPEPGQTVSITLHTVSGQKVKTLFRGVLRPGVRQITWDDRSLLPGLYMVRCVFGNNLIVRRVAMVR
jgi:hypothetical protein